MFRTITATTIVFLFVAGITILNSACKKKNFDYVSFYNCNEKENPTADQLKKNIAGDWTLQSYVGDKGKFITTIERVFLRIESTGTFVLKENDAVTNEGTWDIGKHNLGGYAFVTAEQDAYTSGELSTCDDKLQFSTAKKDGPAYFFVRSN